MVQTPGFSFGSRLSYLSGFTNAACAPSLASNGKTMFYWAGHVTRMEDVHAPKAVFFS